VRRTGCGLLLDVNNVHVSAVNHGFDAAAYVDGFPMQHVGEVHLAGFAEDCDSTNARLLIDDHGRPVDEVAMGRRATQDVECRARLDGLASIGPFDCKPALQDHAPVGSLAGQARPRSHGSVRRHHGIHVGDLAEHRVAHHGVSEADGAELGGREVHGWTGPWGPA